MNSFVNSIITQQLHPTVLDWAERCNNNGGGYPSLRSIESANTFLVTCLNNNLSSSLRTACIFAPDNLIIAQTPLVFFRGPGGRGNSFWSGSGYTSTSLSINGITGTGTGALRTGIWAFDIFGGASGGTNTSVVIYNSLTGSGADGVQMGAAGTIGKLRVGFDFGGIGSYFQCYNDSFSVVDPVTTAWRVGYRCCSKTSATSRIEYYGNSVTTHSIIGSNSTSDGGSSNTPPDTIDIAVFAANEGGTPAGFSKQRLSFISMGDGMSEGQSYNFFKAVQQLRTNLGGGYN